MAHNVPQLRVSININDFSRTVKTPTIKRVEVTKQLSAPITSIRLNKNPFRKQSEDFGNKTAVHFSRKSSSDLSCDNSREPGSTKVTGRYTDELCFEEGLFNQPKYLTQFYTSTAQASPVKKRKFRNGDCRISISTDNHSYETDCGSESPSVCSPLQTPEVSVKSRTFKVKPSTEKRTRVSDYHLQAKTLKMKSAYAKMKRKDVQNFHSVSIPKPFLKLGSEAEEVSGRVSLEPTSPSSPSLKILAFQEDVRIKELSKEYYDALKVAALLQEELREVESVNFDLRQQLNMAVLTSLY